MRLFLFITFIRLITYFTGFHSINNHRYHPKQHHFQGVDTDGTFSEDYYLTRDKARYHAEKRGKMFDAAADAIRKGDGALASSRKKAWIHG
jgi:hypothetical protein